MTSSRSRATATVRRLQPFAPMLHHDDRRVRRHFDRALAMLTMSKTRHWPTGTHTMRDFVFDELRRYRDAMRIPRNYYERARTPVFIDEHGTRCAMAHLLEISGFTDLVQRIAREANYARIRDLAGDRELLLALAAMGLTVDEAARIQPSYEPACTDGATCFCGTYYGPAAAVLTATAETTTMTSMRVRVTAIEGTTAVKLGDLVEVSRAYPPMQVGTTYLVADRASDGGLARVAEQVVTAGEVSCPWHGTAASAVVAKAMVSSDCAGVLAAAYPRWDCTMDHSSGSGCGLHGAGDVGGAALIIALSIGVARLRS